MLHIILDSTGLISWDGAKAQARRAASADMASEEVEGTDATATWLVLLQDLRHLHRCTQALQQIFCQAEALVAMSNVTVKTQYSKGIKLSELIGVCICM